MVPQALELLMRKDVVLEELSEQVARLQADNERLAAAAREATDKAATAESQVLAVLRDKEELRAQLEQRSREFAEQMVRPVSNMEPLLMRPAADASC